MRAFFDTSYKHWALSARGPKVAVSNQSHFAVVLWGNSNMEKMLGRGRGGGSVLAVCRETQVASHCCSIFDCLQTHFQAFFRLCCVRHCVHAGGPAGLFPTTGLQNEKLILLDHTKKTHRNFLWNGFYSFCLCFGKLSIQRLRSLLCAFFNPHILYCFTF